MTSVVENQLSKSFLDEKTSLKNYVEDLVGSSVSQLSNLSEDYYLTIHGKFNKYDPTIFEIDAPVASFKPPVNFMSNSQIYYVSNRRGLCFLLATVSAAKKGSKQEIIFNKEGVAYLQSKGALPS